jgi:hypothetical protein
MPTQSTPFDEPPPTSPTECTGRPKGYLGPRIFCTQAIFQNSHVIDAGCLTELKPTSVSVGRKNTTEVKQKGAILTVHPQATISIGKYNLVVAEIASPGLMATASFNLLGPNYTPVGNPINFQRGVKMVLAVDLRDPGDPLSPDANTYLQLPLPFETAGEIEAL